MKACVSGQTSRGERAHSPLLTSTLSAFLRRENNALACQSPAFKDSQRFNAAAVKTSEQKPLGLHTFVVVVVCALCLPADRPTDRLSVRSNQKFIQTCSALLRLATAMRSPPLSALLSRCQPEGSFCQIRRLRSLAICQGSGMKRADWWKDGRERESVALATESDWLLGDGFSLPATGVRAAGSCVCVDEELHHRGYLLQSASRCSKTRLRTPFVSFSERDWLMCLFSVFQW